MNQRRNVQDICIWNGVAERTYEAVKEKLVGSRLYRCVSNCDGMNVQCDCYLSPRDIGAWEEQAEDVRG